jgi:hypothetical protein
MSIEKGHTMVDNNLHRKRKIEQHEHHKKNQAWNQVLRKGVQFLPICDILLVKYIGEVIDHNFYTFLS